MALLIIGKCLKKNWKFSCRKPKSISAKEIAGRDTREPLFACRTVDAAIASAMTSVLPSPDRSPRSIKFKTTTFSEQNSILQITSLQTKTDPPKALYFIMISTEA